MPLYIDDKQIAAKEFAMLHGMNEEQYARLIKKPIFKLDNAQVKQKTTIITNKNLSEPATQGLKCSFWFKDADQLTKKLVYAEAQNVKVEAGVRVFTYRPQYLFHKGTVVNFKKGEEDKIVFHYFQPGNPLSPFAGQQKMFSFLDPVTETLKAANNLSSIQKALTHATTVEEEELVIIAKGMKLLASDDYDLAELRVKMQQFAIAPATNALYIKAMSDEMIRIEGRIHNCVDKGLMRLEKIPNSSARQWVWATGAKEGAPIGEPIFNVNADAKHHLITAIKTDLDVYLYDLRHTSVLIQADKKAREVLAREKVQVPQHLAEINTASAANGPSLKDEVFDVESAKAFVEKRGYKKIATHVKQFREGVAEGRVNYDNVDLFLASLYNN